MRTSIRFLSEGTYFFKNAELSNYMQRDNNGKNTFELWDFDGDNDQRWSLEHVRDGYYKIVLVSTGKVATSPDDLGNGVWQDTYDGRDVHLWRITAADSNGQRKLSPKKYPSKYMAAGTGADSIPNGRGVKLRDNQSDAKDEWILHKHEDYTLMYLGYNANDPLMPPILNSVESSLKSNANMKGYGYTLLNKNELLIHLSSSEMFSCITHGEQTGIYTSDGRLTVSDINQLSNNAFSNLNFVYLGACLTGNGGSSSNNLVNAIYNKGADNVLGFKGEIFVVEANLWTEVFMTSISTGCSIEQAMSTADTAVRNDENCQQLFYYSTSEVYRYFVGSDEFIPCQ